MTIDHLLKDYQFTRICKELRYFRDDNMPESIDGCNQLFRKLNIDSTNGASIGYKDVTGENQNSILTTILSDTEQKKLAEISNGLPIDKIIPSIEDDLMGYRTTAAVTGYRVIKNSVARLHGAMNSAIALATAIHKSDPNFRSILIDLSVLKRKLAGQGLSAKHGKDNKSIDARGKKLQEIFYTPVDSGWVDRFQVFDFFVNECELPEKEINTLLDVIWTDPPMNINERLRIISPFYMMTRRGASISLLDNVNGIGTTFTEDFLKEENNYE